MTLEHLKRNKREYLTMASFSGICDLDCSLDCSLNLSRT